MGEISRGDASDIEDNSQGWLEGITLYEPCLEEAPFEELCGDNLMVRGNPSVVDTDR